MKWWLLATTGGAGGAVGESGDMRPLTTAGTVCHRPPRVRSHVMMYAPRAGAQAERSCLATLHRELLGAVFSTTRECTAPLRTVLCELECTGSVPHIDAPPCVYIPTVHPCRVLQGGEGRGGVQAGVPAVGSACPPPSTAVAAGAPSGPSRRRNRARELCVGATHIMLVSRLTYLGDPLNSTHMHRDRKVLSRYLLLSFVLYEGVRTKNSESQYPGLQVVDRPGGALSCA